MNSSIHLDSNGKASTVLNRNVGFMKNSSRFHQEVEILCERVDTVKELLASINKNDIPNEKKAHNISKSRSEIRCAKRGYVDLQERGRILCSAVGDFLKELNEEIRLLEKNLQKKRLGLDNVTACSPEQAASTLGLGQVKLPANGQSGAVRQDIKIKKELTGWFKRNL